MIIRAFIPADQLGVTRLQEEFMREFFPEFADDPRQYQWNADIYDIGKAYLLHGGKFWVAEDNGEIVGVGGYHLISPTAAEIKRVRIRAAYRGRGLGKSIIRLIEADCRDRQVSQIFVDTDERLATAKALYEKLGYTVYRTETEEDGGQTYINHYFRKDLL